jgi:hypothetical protein
MLTEEQKSNCLAYDPFAGDFGMPGDRALKDKIVVGRAVRRCNECLQRTEPGTNHRVMAWLFDGEFHHYRICEKCCVAMAAWAMGDESLMDERESVREQTEKEMRNEEKSQM